MLPQPQNSEVTRLQKSIEILLQEVLFIALEKIGEPSNLHFIEPSPSSMRKSSERLCVPTASALKDVLHELSILCIKYDLYVSEDAQLHLAEDRILSTCSIQIIDKKTNIPVLKFSDVGEAFLITEFAARMAYTTALNRVMMKLLPNSFRKALEYISKHYDGNPEFFTKTYKPLLEKKKQKQKIS